MDPEEVLSKVPQLQMGDGRVRREKCFDGDAVEAALEREALEISKFGYSAPYVWIPSC